MTTIVPDSNLVSLHASYLQGNSPGLKYILASHGPCKFAAGSLLAFAGLSFLILLLKAAAS